MGADKIKEDAKYVAGKVKEAVKQDPEKKKKRVEKHKEKHKNKLKRKEARQERRRAGKWWMKKKKKQEIVKNNKQDENVKKSLARVASGDSVTGSDESVSMKYGKKMGVSMKSNQSGGRYNAKNPAAAAKQLMRNQRDGGSMYGEKHGSSMNTYDKKMMHLREQISDDKKAIHRTDQAKKSHAHPIFKHMRKF